MRSFMLPALLVALVCSLVPSVICGHGKYWYNEISQKVQWEEPTYLHKDETGNFYYIDPTDGSTTWTKPKEFAWTAHMQKEYPDREFYYNSVTDESTWDKPEVLAWKVVDSAEL